MLETHLFHHFDHRAGQLLPVCHRRTAPQTHRKYPLQLSSAERPTNEIRRIHAHLHRPRPLSDENSGKGSSNNKLIALRCVQKPKLLQRDRRELVADHRAALNLQNVNKTT